MGLFIVHSCLRQTKDNTNIMLFLKRLYEAQLLLVQTRSGWLRKTQKVWLQNKTKKDSAQGNSFFNATQNNWEQFLQKKQARKAQRCDSYLQIWNYHPLTHWLTDWLTKYVRSKKVQLSRSRDKHTNVTNSSTQRLSFVPRRPCLNVTL